MIKSIISERELFEEYQSYRKGRMSDPSGDLGHNLASEIMKVSSVLGFPEVNRWADSFELSIKELQDFYGQVSKLGKDSRDTERAASIVGTFFEEKYGNCGTNPIFFMPYKQKRRIISRLTKYAEARLNNI